ncbi:MAG: MmgE/PrpD family protein [Parvularculaceae bacterium]|nr:MmgE/PrpD family protein [Parvularculaceae bacterium]
MTDLLDAFLDHADRVRRDGLPAEAKAAAKTFLVDSLAVGIAGSKASLADDVLGAALAWGGAGPVPLFGAEPRYTNKVTAAFVNGFRIHCQEYDCVHEPAVVHPMATIFAALSAEVMGAEGETSGPKFLSAIALAVDVAATLGVAAKSGIRFFRPANAGIFGATMGVAFLRDLSAEQTRNAMGYALSFNSGTMQPHVEGKPALPIQIGNAARGAIMAVDLAEAGVPGALNSLEGPFGYFALFETEVSTEGLAEALSKIWRITEVSHKPFPTGRAAQGGIVLAQRARTKIDIEDIANIELSAPPLIERLVGRPATSDMTANYARLCFPFLAAVTMRHGTVTLEHFTADALANAETIKLAEKFSVRSNHIQDPAAFNPQTLTITLRSGELVTETASELYGSPDFPMTPEAQREKVEQCLSFAHGRPMPQLAERIWGVAKNLENLTNVAEFLQLGSGGEH